MITFIHVIKIETLYSVSVIFKKPSVILKESSTRISNNI